MAKFSGQLSRRYGTALFESLRELFTNNNDAFIKASENIVLFAKTLDKDLLKILNNKHLNFTQKQEIIKEILKSIFKETENSPLTQCVLNFISLIVKNNRCGFMHSILNFYLKLSDSYLGIVRASIVSAREMSQDIIRNLESAILNSVQKKVIFSNFIDKSLQCGFLVKIGSTDIDASLKSIIFKLNESMG